MGGSEAMLPRLPETIALTDSHEGVIQSAGGEVAPAAHSELAAAWPPKVP